MYYHARVDIADRRQGWWDWDKESLVAEIVLPYVHQQVRHVPSVSRGGRALINFAAANHLAIFKTERELHPDGFPEELSDLEWMTAHNCTAEIVAELRLDASTPKVHSLLQQALAPPEDQLFVAMKFGDELLDSAYEGVIKPVGAKYGLAVLRVDEIEDSGLINLQMLEEIAKSRVVLADMTGARPNVYYEAGYAHAIGKEMIFTIHAGDRVHFDLAPYRFIEWSTELQLRERLCTRLAAIVASDAGSSE